MLRRKLIIILGVLLGLLLVTAVTAIVLLTDVLGDLNRISSDALQRTARTTEIASTLTSIEQALNTLRLGVPTPIDDLIEDAEHLTGEVEALGQAAFDGDGPRLLELEPTLRERVASIATDRDRLAAAEGAERALATSFEMRQAIATISRNALDRTEQAQHEVTRKFRLMLIALALIFVAVINLSMMVLLRAAGMVLRPVDQLVEASRRLAHEEFDYRVHLEQHDEFDELAEASNALAEQLQRNEQRKIETLQQVATTLAHELNNAITVIDLQLELVARRPDAPPDPSRLEQINAALRRMRDTVMSLGRVRRIVLTDYARGVKMLDLERSVEE